MDRETSGILQKEAVEIRQAIAKSLASSKARCVAMDRWAKEIEGLVGAARVTGPVLTRTDR
jgi:hypothetical protein